jgi:hypothetical protein
MQNKLANYEEYDSQNAEFTTKVSRISSALSAISLDEEEHEDVKIHEETPVVDANIFQTSDAEIGDAMHSISDAMATDEGMKSVLNRTLTPKCKFRIKRRARGDVRNCQPSMAHCNARRKSQESYSHLKMLMSLSQLCLLNNRQEQQPSSRQLPRSKRAEEFSSQGHYRAWQSAWSLQSPSTNLEVGTSYELERAAKNREWKSALTLESPGTNRDWKNAWAFESPADNLEMGTSMTLERPGNDSGEGRSWPVDNPVNNLRSGAPTRVESEGKDWERKLFKDSSSDEVFYQE